MTAPLPPGEELAAQVAELEQQLDYERLYPLAWVNRRVRDRLGNAVIDGPFADMRFPDWGLTGVDLYAPKVIGSYERELHPSLERAIAATPPVVVNIGSAEGYYAVGLKLRLPGARVLAYDTDRRKAQKLEGIAAVNGVDVEAHGEACDHVELRSVLVSGALVVCDCDGCEDVLLDPTSVPMLDSCTLLVETHDLLRAGITKRLLEAFSGTHDVERIPTEPRFVADFPVLGDLPLVTRQLAISEFRHAPMEFLVLTPALRRAAPLSGAPTR